MGISGSSGEEVEKIYNQPSPVERKLIQSTYVGLAEKQ